MLFAVQNSKPPSAMSSVFPEDILSEILIRLPVKSIGKSRCVSKHWNSLLTSPRFIRTHLARSHQKKLLMVRDSNSLSIFTLRPDGVAEFENRDPIPTLDQKFMLFGHCNGLVLIGALDACRLNSNPGYLLMNPTTSEYLKLPQPPSFSFGDSRKGVMRLGNEYGLGYDSSSDDYKFVQLFVLCNINDHMLSLDRPLDRLLDPEFSEIFADIYSFKNKCWRRVNIDHRPFFSKGATNGPGVFLNGALHWLCRDTIVAFDLTSENCYEIPSLGNRQHKFECTFTTLNKGSCLGIVCWDKTDQASIEIWTMKEYGIAESWTKNVRVVVDGSADTTEKRPWFWRDTLVIQYPYKLTFYSFNDEESFSMSLETRTIFHNDSMRLEGGQTVDDDGLIPVGKGHLVDGLIFTESLVSPLLL